MIGARKESCYSFKNKKPSQRNGCLFLDCLQCEKHGRCSFYETEEQYHARQAGFAERLAAAERGK